MKLTLKKEKCDFEQMFESRRNEFLELTKDLPTTHPLRQRFWNMAQKFNNNLKEVRASWKA
jgi:hypothetical protein